MKILSFLLFIGLCGLSSVACAHSKLIPATDASAHSIAPAQNSIPENARAAVAAVERFSTAIANAQFDRAAAELDANVLILESGGAEHSAAEYFSEHSKADADFLKAVHVELTRRTAQANGDMAWVGSESEMHLQKDGKTIIILSTETMVLKRSGSTWKIVHIHWSSHTKKT